MRIAAAVDHLEQSKQELVRLGFQKPRHQSFEKLRLKLQEARDAATEIVHYGEELLLYHRRLAQSRHVHQFYGYHGILTEWERYAAGDRIFFELNGLIDATSELVDGFGRITLEDGEWLLNGLELPDHLAADFNLAQNLFSAGFDEVGVLIAARGLEGVLRGVADKKGITIISKGRQEPAAEADAHSIIEALYNCRWSSDKRRVVDARTRALLNYLRVVRNESAHPTQARVDRATARENAILVAAAAGQLWRDATKPRARLTTKIERNW